MIFFKRCQKFKKNSNFFLNWKLISKKILFIWKKVFFFFLRYLKMVSAMDRYWRRLALYSVETKSRTWTRSRKCFKILGKIFIKIFFNSVFGYPKQIGSDLKWRASSQDTLKAGCLPEQICCHRSQGFSTL
jgi:hypothetical protein